MFCRIPAQKKRLLLLMLGFATGLFTGFILWGFQGTDTGVSDDTGYISDIMHDIQTGTRYQGRRFLEDIIGKWNADATRQKGDQVIRVIGGDEVGKWFKDAPENMVVTVIKDHVATEDEILEMRSLITNKIKDMKEAGVLVTMGKQRMCRVREGRESRCIDPNCTGSLPSITSRKNLQSVLKPVKIIGNDKLREVIKAFRVPTEAKEYVIITGASSNHFDESQAAIQSLHQHVLPHISNYSFYYYDLGLTEKQRQLIREVSGAELRSFPFNKLPDHVRFLKCYTWKALLILAHIETARFVLWMDSSVRYTEDIRPYFHKASKTGFLINRNNFHMPQHTHLKMFSYFGDQACQFSPYGEVETGFLVFHNEPFIRRVIVEPWGACALDHNCMCPEESKKIYRCPMYRQYGKCHRYEQTTLGYIAIKVLRENRPSTFLTDFHHTIGHDNEGSYLLELKNAKKLKYRNRKQPLRQ